MEQALMNHSEVFLHTQNCFDDFNDSRNVLREIRKSSNETLRNAAFKYAVIAYCRAYTSSKGQHDGPRRLDKKYIPHGFYDLHQELLGNRHKIYAHTDRDLLEAKLKVTDLGGQKLPVRTQNVIYPLNLMVRIDEIIELAEKTMDAIIDDYPNLLARITD
jgi:hypothetical protein